MKRSTNGRFRASQYVSCTLAKISLKMSAGQWLVYTENHQNKPHTVPLDLKHRVCVLSAWAWSLFRPLHTCSEPLGRIGIIIHTINMVTWSKTVRFFIFFIQTLFPQKGCAAENKRNQLLTLIKNYIIM